jgi:antitoxin ParD1/3/4
VSCDLGQLAELKADIDRGLADVAQGRLAKFDAKRIIARGTKLLASTSALPRQQK